MKRIVLGLVLALLPSSAWALEITDFGGAPDSGDTTPALARALTVALSGPDRTIHFGAGDYAFLTTPPVLSGGVQLQGEGPYNTTLTRHYSNGEFLVGHGNGLAFRRFAIGSIVGTHGGTALHLIASDAIGRGVPIGPAAASTSSRTCGFWRASPRARWGRSRSRSFSTARTS